MAFRKAVRRPAKKSTVRKRTTKKRVNTIKKIAKQVIRQQAEHKICSDAVTATNFNSGITSTSEMYPAYPPMFRGQTQNARNGDDVRAKALILRGRIRISNTSTAPQPKQVFLYVLEDKVQRDNNAVTTFQFLNDGDGGMTNFDGSVLNSLLPVYVDRFRVIAKKTFRLTQDYMPGSVQTNRVDLASKSYAYFNIKIPLKGKELRYDNSGSYGYPENSNIVYCLGYVNQDGAIDVALQDVELQMQKMLYYMD